MSAPATIAAAALVPVAAAWLVPAAAELVVLLRAAGRHAAPAMDGIATLRVLVLVPAHDEELLVGACLASLKALRRERSRTTALLLPDGCRDRTAEVARGLGIGVLDHGGAALGKAQLIAWALERIDLDAYDVVAVIDADSVVDPGFCDALASGGPLRDAAAQGYIEFDNAGESWLTRLGALHQAVRYRYQYPMRARAGLNVPLTGNAMCFGVDLLRDEGFPAATINEDTELFARYTARGRRVVYVRDARISTPEPRTLAQAAVQRGRWQAGRRRAVRDLVARLLRAPISAAQRLDAIAETLPIGPVAHAAIGVMLAGCLLVLPGALARLVAAAFLLSVAPMVVWTLVALVRHPDRGPLLAALARLPFYAAWRVALLAHGLLSGGPVSFRRTPRHSTSSGT